MSYLQEEGISKSRMRSWIIVGLLHVFLGYVLVSGLAVEVYKQVTGPLEAVNIEEQAPPPDEPPPPPPKLEDIPPYVPPPDVVVQVDTPPPPTIQTQTVVQQPAPTVVAPPAPPAPPPAPPVAKGPTKRAQPIARTFVVSEDDYPSASRRAGEEGVTGIQVTIGTDGRVKSCTVISSSGSPRLDEAACRIAERRWRFTPAELDGQKVEETVRRNYRWQLRDGR